jgi:FG-GAP-like repeat
MRAGLAPRCKHLAFLAALLASLSATALAATTSGPTFSPPRHYDPPGRGIAAIAVQDLNRDGRSDLVVGAGGRDHPDATSVLLAGRRGRLVRAHRVGFAGTGDVAVGDLNGDRRRDLVRVSTNLPSPDANVLESEYAVLLGGGRGGFEAPMVTPTECCAEHLAIGDFNRDGRRDLVLVPPPDFNGAGIYGSPRVLFGDGTGRFPTSRPLAVGLASGVVVADLNVDRKLDLLILTSSEIPEPAYLLFGDGRGGFSAPRPLPAGGVVSLAIGRFNRDRRPDLATVSFDFLRDRDLVQVLLGTRGGRFRRFGRYLVARFPREIVAADFNRDGRQDLAVNGDNSFERRPGVRVLLGTGKGTFHQTGRLFRCCAGLLSVGFFNRDRKPDLAGVFGGRLSIRLNITR